MPSLHASFQPIPHLVPATKEEGYIQYWLKIVTKTMKWLSIRENLFTCGKMVWALITSTIGPVSVL
jgi:hypothetical protein